MAFIRVILFAAICMFIVVNVSAQLPFTPPPFDPRPTKDPLVTVMPTPASYPDILVPEGGQDHMHWDEKLG